MVLKLMTRCGMKNGKSHVTNVMRRNATLTRRDQDKNSNWDRMTGLSQKLVVECRTEKHMLDPQCSISLSD